ncbi:unnamed protein product [Meloidogyne enterolobii]|uniref:Uncharacterized protein n=1 Tax=Meloidogyne enterolobii TaxID=390850 RepID=A0ACB0ZWP8_MELEN
MNSLFLLVSQYYFPPNSSLAFNGFHFNSSSFSVSDPSDSRSTLSSFSKNFKNLSQLYLTLVFLFASNLP